MRYWYKCESIEERKEIVITLQKWGYIAVESTLRDIDSPSDFYRWPVIDIVDNYVTLSGRRVEPNVDSVLELYRLCGINNETPDYRSGVIKHRFI